MPKKSKIETEHVVFWSSTGASKSANGWLYYHCHTCGHTTIHAGQRESDEHWAKVVADFNRQHPHTEQREAAWI